MKKIWIYGMGLIATMVGTANADVLPHEFQVVGTWGNLASWQNLEKPFWDDSLPLASNGKLTGKAIPITEAGLKGTEVMRLLNQGVFEVAHGLGSYVAADNPAIEGVDLSSIAPDFSTMRKITDAYRDIMNQSFGDSYGATILSLHPWPASMIYCTTPISSMSDLQGRKVRVHSATLADFVEGAGGVTVTLPFSEVVPALERGVADCAITDPVSAYNAKWHEVINHVFSLRVGYSITFTAINTALWDSFNEETRSLMSTELEEFEDKGWANAEAMEAMGVACLTGGDCSLGEAGNAELVEPGEADMSAGQVIIDEFVLPRWLDRCGAECATNWNSTAGAAAGLSISID